MNRDTQSVIDYERMTDSIEVGETAKMTLFLRLHVRSC